MHDTSERILARVDRFVAERIRPAVYRDARALDVSTWQVPDEPVSFEHARAQEFTSCAPGGAWGKPWGTDWFHITGQVPGDWTDAGAVPELVVDLGFTTATSGFQAEGLVYTADGTILKAVEPRGRGVALGEPGSVIDLYLEAAANPDVFGSFAFAPTALGDPLTAGDAAQYRLGRIDVAIRDVTVWELLQDVDVLADLARELPDELPRRAEILAALARAIDAIDPDDVAGTTTSGRDALRPVLAKPAYASAHRVVAVGHAHIDSAWLWPTREAVRKVARTFSNVLALMANDPEFVFAASSAQHYAWLKEHYPALFERVKREVEAGRFVPVGGMWVESDTNMPGGEAMARQFVLGKRFFIDELGVDPLEVWLPDSFGYSAALPQIIAAAGSRWMLTQKLSWNDTNRMPHHTFDWEGIDGTRIFTHFPPVDTYNSRLSAAELALAQRQFAEKGAANSSLVPFGWGDGGGGPTREMLAAARRERDLEGSPRVRLASPRAFFEAAEAEYASPPVWSGELYLELHRGTYTSQARTKRGNRRSEHLLREAELWAALCSIRLGSDYPYDVLESAWHTVLLQQFHDVLPGSSIAWVYREAEHNYDVIAETLEQLIGQCQSALTGVGEASVVFNAGPYEQDGVPAFGAGFVDLDLRAAPAVTRMEAGFVLENAFVRLEIDHDGLFTSVRDLVADRELLPDGMAGNVLQLFRDTPAKWDAWDIDAEYANSVTELTRGVSIGITHDGAGVRVTRSTGRSGITQKITLQPDSAAINIVTRVDWREKQKLLKLAFPMDLHADRAASEIQFGHVYRPTHANTSWDAARFETIAHRWVHVAEAGYGVAVANDSTYGHDIRRTTTPAGRSVTTVRLSLLRAPLFPDPAADQGVHEFTVSLRVGSGIADAVAEGYRLNLPLRQIAGTGAVEPLLTVDNAAVVVEAVKLAEDRSGDVIVRLYEAHGSRARATLTPGFETAGAIETDLLERPLHAASAVVGEAGTGLQLVLRPFQLVTLRFSRSV